MDAKYIILKEYGISHNFMTPRLIGYYQITPNLGAELSVGEGIERGTKLYGVSVAEFFPATGKTARRRDLSDCFRTRQQALDHIQTLKEKEDLDGPSHSDG